MMQDFIEKIQDEEAFQLIVDLEIFPKEIIFKTAYNFIDLGYFFFLKRSEKELLVQFRLGQDTKKTCQGILLDFSTELLHVLLRSQLEKENRIIRETIIAKALYSTLDTHNFISIDSGQIPEKTIDFSRDLQEVLKDISIDPELFLDSEEINKIMQDLLTIEQSVDIEKPVIKIDTKAIDKAKKLFKN